MVPAAAIRPSYSRPGAVSDAVDMPVIRAVVDDFYGRIRQDPMLGPVFEAHIEDWGPHLVKMYGFWSTVLLGDRQYTGNPFVKHQAISELSAGHFERWLNLFADTLESHCSAADKAAWEATARRMGFAMASRLGFGRHTELVSGGSQDR
jgi:hemoglobin